MLDALIILRGSGFLVFMIVEPGVELRIEAFRSVIAPFGERKGQFPTTEMR